MSKYGAKFKYYGQNWKKIITLKISRFVREKTPNPANFTAPPPLIGVSKTLKCIPLDPLQGDGATFFAHTEDEKCPQVLRAQVRSRNFD